MNASTNDPSLIRERARVLRVADGFIWVRCESQTGCARCAAGQGCGGGLFARLLRGRLRELPLKMTTAGEAAIKPGDWVWVGLSAAAVQNAALLAYGFPLAGLLLGALAGDAIGDVGGGNDIAALFGAIIGLAAGLLVARRSAARLAGQADFHPLLLRRLRPDEPCPAEPET